MNRTFLTFADLVGGARPRAALAEFTRTIVDSYDISELLHRLADRAAEVLEISGAGVSIGDDSGSLRFVSADAELSVQVEAAQERLQQGPCMDAYRSGDLVIVEELSDRRWAQRWPEFVPEVLDLGVPAIAGIPMAVDQQRIGALNLYAETAGPWSEEKLNAARILADVASGYLLNAVAIGESRAIASQLQHALDSRVVIEQAKGILMARHGLAPEAAFMLLRKQARSDRRNLHDLATAVVAGDVVF